MKKLFLCGLMLVFMAVFIPQTTCAAYDFPVLTEREYHQPIISKAIMESPSDNVGCFSRHDGQLKTSENMFNYTANKTTTCRSGFHGSRLSDNSLYTGFT